MGSEREQNVQVAGFHYTFSGESLISTNWYNGSIPSLILSSN